MDGSSCSEPGVLSLVSSVFTFVSPLFTFWFCTYRTLQKPHRPPHLGAAMESEYFLLGTPVWEQVVPRGGGCFGASEGKGQAMTQWFGSYRYVSNVWKVENVLLGYRTDFIAALGLWGWGPAARLNQVPAWASQCGWKS